LAWIVAAFPALSFSFSLLKIVHSKTDLMKYFSHCQTIEEVKTLYKELAKKHHPDCGGDTATMQSINTEYAFACSFILKGGKFTAEQADEQIRISEEFRKVIEQIIHLPGIIIEVVGNWIWVTGNTYPVKSQLKAAGMFFASKKVAWYFRTDEFKTRGSNKSLEEIRRKYGSERINLKANTKILE
jgi:hypothetical protein